MPLGRVLYESGSELQHVYFLTDGIVSLLYVMQNGASAEIAVVGNEGAVGISLFMGGESTPSRSLVQSAGHAYRLPRSRVKEEFNRHGQLLVLMLRYTQALITQVAQTAVCNRHSATTSFTTTNLSAMACSICAPTRRSSPPSITRSRSIATSRWRRRRRG